MNIKLSYMKARKNIQAWGWRQSWRFNAKVHDLNYFFWETTLSCNLNCRHCGSECDKDKEIEELPAHKVLQVFENIAKNYDPKKIMVAATGGEPLVRRDLFEILSQVRNMGFSWGMVTNGMLVTEDIVGKCEATGMKTVSISLDGLKDSHNWLRNNDLSYDRALNAIRLFLNSGKFQVVEPITCVNSKNVDQLEDMYNMFMDMGVEAWRLFTIFPKGRAESNRELLLNKDLIIKLFNFIREKRKLNPSFHISYSEEGYLGCDWEREVRDDFFYCGAGIDVGSLLSDGSYSACPSLSREWIQGHVDEISFSEAWENRYLNMRNRSWMRTKSCSSCKQWKNCNGSSLHMWDFEKNETKVCHLELLNS